MDQETAKKAILLRAMGGMRGEMTRIDETYRDGARRSHRSEQPESYAMRQAYNNVVQQLQSDISAVKAAEYQNAYQASQTFEFESAANRLKQNQTIQDQTMQQYPNPNQYQYPQPQPQFNPNQYPQPQPQQPVQSQFAFMNEMPADMNPANQTITSANSMDELTSLTLTLMDKITELDGKVDKLLTGVNAIGQLGIKTFNLTEAINNKIEDGSFRPTTEKDTSTSATSVANTKVSRTKKPAQ